MSLTTLISFGEISFAEEKNSTVLVDDKGEHNYTQNSTNDEKSYALCECTKVLAPDEILLKLTENVIAKKRVSEIIPGMKKIFFEPSEQLERQIADFKKANEITFSKRISDLLKAILSTSIGGTVGYLVTTICEKFKTKQKVKESDNKNNDKNGRITKKDIAIFSAICCFLGFVIKYCSFRDKKATEFKKLLDDLRDQNIIRSAGLGGFRCMLEDDHSELPQNANKKHLLSKFKQDLERIISEEEKKEANRSQESIDNLNFYKAIKLF